MKNLIKFNNFFNLLVISTILILFSLFNFGHPSHLNNVGGYYLNNAINFYNYGEFLVFKRGPIYSLFLSMHFYLFEPSFKIAHWATQFSYLLSIISLYILTNKLFRKEIAFYTCIYAVFSVSLFRSSWTIDAGFLQTFFLLIFIYYFIVYLDKNKLLYLFLSALFYSFAILTKESALFYVFLPFFLSLTVIKKKLDILVYFFKIIIFFFIVFLFLIPWIYILVENGYNAFKILGELNPSGGASIQEFGASSYFIFIKKLLLEGVPSIFYVLLKSEIFFPIVIIGFIIATYKLYNFNTKYIIHFILFLNVAPILVIYGIFLDGYRQIISQLLIIYIYSGISIYYFLKLNKKIIIILSILSVIPIFITYSLNKEKFLNKNINITNFFKVRFTGKFSTDVVTGGRMNDEIIEISKFILNEIPVKSRLFVGGVFDDSIKFLTTNQYSYFFNKPNYYELRSDLFNNLLKRNDFKDKELFQIITLKNFKSDQRRYREFYLLFRDDFEIFLSNIKKNDYLFIFNSPKKSDKLLFSEFNKFLIDNSKVIYSSNGNMILTELPSKLGQINYKNLLDKNLKENIVWLKNNYNDEYQDLKKILKKINNNLDNYD
tara:strand:+ start:6667 stop:8475 length:1809 start_codon:yes stop_codon:yes gene_type:complete